MERREIERKKERNREKKREKREKKREKDVQGQLMQMQIYNCAKLMLGLSATIFSFSFRELNAD